jgi:hypothetical protein
LAQAIFKPDLFLYKYPNNLIPVILPAYTAYEDRTECSETSAYKIQTPGNHLKERIQQSTSYFAKAIMHEGLSQQLSLKLTYYG